MILDKLGNKYDVHGVSEIRDKQGNVYYQAFGEYENVALGIVPWVSSVFNDFHAFYITDGIIDVSNKRWISTVEDTENKVVFTFPKLVKINKMVFYTGTGSSYAIPGVELYVRGEKIAEYHNNPVTNFKKEIYFTDVKTDTLEIRFFQDGVQQTQHRVYEIEIWGYEKK